MKKRSIYAVGAFALLALEIPSAQAIEVGEAFKGNIAKVRSKDKHENRKYMVIADDAGQRAPQISIWTYSMERSKMVRCTSEAYPELVSMVQSAGKKNFGSFQLNEFGNVVVPTQEQNPTYTYAGQFTEGLELACADWEVTEEPVAGKPGQTKKVRTKIDVGVINSEGEGPNGMSAEGAEWFGPLAGLPYFITTDGDIAFAATIAPNMEIPRIRLSSFTDKSKVAPLVEKIARVAGRENGRFFVNEQGKIVVPKINATGDVEGYLFAGDIDLTNWFPSPVSYDYTKYGTGPAPTPSEPRNPGKKDPREPSQPDDPTQPDEPSQPIAPTTSDDSGDQSGAGEPVSLDDLGNTGAKRAFRR